MVRVWKPACTDTTGRVRVTARLWRGINTSTTVPTSSCTVTADLPASQYAASANKGLHRVKAP